MQRCLSVNKPMKWRLCRLLILAAAMLLILSCATLSGYGVGRIKRYEVQHAQLPKQFDGYRVAFISDLHYKSLFTEKRLSDLVNELQQIAPDALLGGDYIASDGDAYELFSSISSVKTTDGTYAVLGNHERNNAGLVADAMWRNGVVLLADDTVRVEREGAAVYFVGIADSFKYDSTRVQPVEWVPDSLFTLLLCHTTDYAERSGTSADLVLSGHTHGGQVSFFGIYTPVRNSAYGSAFLRGRNETSQGVTVITTNGVGTSRRKVRFCVPSEAVVVTLRRKE